MNKKGAKVQDQAFHVSDPEASSSGYNNAVPAPQPHPPPRKKR